MNPEILVGLLGLFGVIQILSVILTQTNGGIVFINLKLIPFVSACMMIWAAIYIQTTIH